MNETIFAAIGMMFLAFAGMLGDDGVRLPTAAAPDVVVAD